MNSNAVFQTPQQLQFGEAPAVHGTLVFRLTIPGRLPSWNQILGMEQWARYKFKDQLQLAFLYALQVAAKDCSMKTTSAKNTFLIAADILLSYRAMAQARRISRSAKRRSNPEHPKKPSSKSLKSKVPF